MTELEPLQPSVSATVAPHLLVVASSYVFDETVARLRDAIEVADLWIIDEIDPTALLRKGGFATTRLRQLLWFHPRYMARLLQTDAGALPEVPLKFVIIEETAGTTVKAFNPARSFAPYAKLTPLAAELLDLTERMLATVSVAASSAGDRV
jgi:uncharacterized protein (DUF302 family)